MKILKFGASWCSPCKALKENLKGFDKCEIFDFDADINPEIFEKYGIRKLPTLLFVDDEGEEIKRLVGGLSKERLEEEFDYVVNERNT